MKKLNTKEVVSETCYKSVEEFLKHFEDVKEVKLVAVNNILSQGGSVSSKGPYDMFNHTNNIFGYGQPAPAVLIAKCKNRKVTDTMREGLRKLFSSKKNEQIDSLVCAGNMIRILKLCLALTD